MLLVFFKPGSMLRSFSPCTVVASELDAGVDRVLFVSVLRWLSSDKKFIDSVEAESAQVKSDFCFNRHALPRRGGIIDLIVATSGLTIPCCKRCNPCSTTMPAGAFRIILDRFCNRYAGVDSPALRRIFASCV